MVFHPRLMAALLVVAAFSQTTRAEPPTISYDDAITRARQLLDEGKFAEAYLAASAATSIDDNRWEAYGVMALALGARGNNTEAVAQIDKALTLAPPDKRDTLQRLRIKFTAPAGANPPAAPEAQAPASGALSPDDQRKLDALMLIIADADKAPSAKERVQYLREFLTKSLEFACAHETLTDLWLLRAAAAVELDYPSEGWLAARRLKALPPEQQQQPKVRQVMAQLERKEWLGNEPKSRGSWRTDDARIQAEAGDAHAQWLYALALAEGLGVTKDEAQAANWYRKAAEAGNADAMASLCLMYQEGQGVTKDERQAVHWCRKVAEAGKTSAMIDLGWRYSNGQGVAKDEQQAVHWYRKAAEAGNAVAMNNLGAMYSNGQGVAKDEQQAVHWYRKAAEAGNADAKYRFGWLRYDEDDFVEASKLLTEASTKLEAKYAEYARLILAHCVARQQGAAAGRASTKEWLRQRKPFERDEWMIALVKHAAGDLTDAQLLELVKADNEESTRGRTCEAYYYIGYWKLIQGDKQAAKAFFQKCVDTQVTSFSEFRSAQRQLSRLQQ